MAKRINIKNSVTKKVLTKAVSKRYSFDQPKVSFVYEELIRYILDGVRNCGQISIDNFGIFSLSSTPDYIGSKNDQATLVDGALRHCFKKHLNFSTMMFENKNKFKKLTKVKVAVPLKKVKKTTLVKLP